MKFERGRKKNQLIWSFILKIFETGFGTVFEIFVFVRFAK